MTIANWPPRNPGTAVNWSTDGGWYVDFPSTGERINLDPQLVLGTLVVTTNVPNNNACTAGGDSWIYQFNYKTGQAVNTASDGEVGRLPLRHADGRQRDRQACMACR